MQRQHQTEKVVQWPDFGKGAQIYAYLLTACSDSWLESILGISPGWLRLIRTMAGSAHPVC